jgi:hypothetical protein
VGKYAVDHAMSAKRKFSHEFELDINQSTVQLIKNEYLKNRRREDENIEFLPRSKRGRKVLLGQENGEHGTRLYQKAEGERLCHQHSYRHICS